MKRQTFIVSLAVILLATSLGASMPPRTRPGERWALVAITDPAAGRALSGALIQSYGYRPMAVITLLGSDATSRNIHQALSALAEKTSPGDSVLIHIELPSAGEAVDTAYIPAGSNPSERWTQLTMFDLAKSLHAIRASTMLLVLPLCVSPRMNVADTLGPLFARSGKSLSVITFCARNTAGPSMASSIAHVLQSDHDVDVPFGVEDVSNIVQKSMPADIRLWSPPGSSGQPFVFLPTRGRLSSYTEVLLGPNVDEKARDEAIHRLVEALLSEPPDRRAELLEARPELEQIAMNAATSPSLRVKAISALGEVQHPRAAQIFLAIYEQSPAAPIIRRSVIEAAAKLTPPGGEDLLRRALADDEATVRVVAIRAIGQRRDEASKSRLAEILQSEANPDVRIATMQSLSLFPDPDGTSKILVAIQLDAPEPAVRREAVVAWIAMDGAPWTDAVLNRLVGDPDPTVRQTVAYSLGRIKPERAEDLEAVVDALRAAATPLNPSIVRQAAIWSLGELGTAAEKPLLAIVQNPKDEPKIIAAAAEALGKQKSRRAVRSLIELIRSPDVEIRTSAASALGAIGDSSARVISALFEATRTGDTFLRAAAESSLEKLSPRREDLLPLLKDVSPLVRADAAARIGSAKDPNDLKDLSSLLSDSDPRVRDSVLNVLAQYEDAGSRAQLSALLSAEDPYRREAAAQLIGMWKWMDGADDLAQHVKDDDPRVRAQVVKSLGRIGSPETSRLVIDAAGDPDPRVRVAAAEALTSFSSQEVVPVLRKMSEDANPEVRQAAIDVLRKQNSGPP